MTTIKRFISTEVPLWAAVLALFATLAIAAGLFMEDYRRTVNDYAVLAEKVLPGDDFIYGPQPTLANENFFNQVKESMVSQKADFIEADLSNMDLRVYKDGVVAKEVKILAKGKEGSWWETPAGLYKIETLEKNHFSSFGKVYQPWSMAFQGNFFIHGWPYYPDGTPVSSSFSGGCIRLSNEDAEAVFALAERSMPVLVFEKDFGKDDFAYELKRPSVRAESYLAADLGNSFVFLEKDSRVKKDVGSLSQLVTALVAAEYVNLDKEVEYAPGKSATAVNLLYPLMLESSADMANALSGLLGESWFVSLMNKKTEALGMKDTRFADPAGDEPGNVSTPEDMFALAKYIRNNRSFVWKISTGNLNYSAYGTPTFKNLENVNAIPGMPLPLVGAKFADNDGNQSLVGVYELSIRGEKRTVAIVVFNSSDAKADALSIANYVVSSYK